MKKNVKNSKTVPWTFSFLNPWPGCRKLSHSSEMETDDLMHREGLQGYN